MGKFFRRHTVGSGGEAFDVVIPYRPIEETIARLYYPERVGGGATRTYLRAMGNLLDNYGNPHAAKWLNGLLDWLETRLDLLPVEWTSDTVQDAARDYTSELVVVPKPKRWSFEEWLALTLTPKEEIPDMYTIA